MEEKEIIYDLRRIATLETDVYTLSAIEERLAVQKHSLPQDPESVEPEAERIKSVKKSWVMSHAFNA